MTDTMFMELVTKLDKYNTWLCMEARLNCLRVGISSYKLHRFIINRKENGFALHEGCRSLSRSMKRYFNRTIMLQQKADV